MGQKDRINIEASMHFTIFDKEWIMKLYIFMLNLILIKCNYRLL
jgi:hypothetical protein